MCDGFVLKCLVIWIVIGMKIVRVVVLLMNVESSFEIISRVVLLI